MLDTLIWTMGIIAVLALVAIWLYRSLTNFVDANEMGVRVLFGKEDPDVCVPGGGHIFVPLLPAVFKCSLEIYPMGMFDLDYDPINVMSKTGKYDGKDYKAVEIAVESRAYLNFPREREMLVREDNPDVPACFLKDLSPAELRQLRAMRRVKHGGVWLILERTHPLIKLLRAGVPIPRITSDMTIEERSAEMEKLQDWSEEGMTNSVRSAAAQMTWKQANEDPVAFRTLVEKSYLAVDGALIQAGFRPSGIKLAIKFVDPPQQLKDALAAEEAAPHVAAREKIEAGDAWQQMVQDQIATSKVELTRAEKMEIRKECLNLIVRKQTMKGGGKLIDARISNADGSPLASGSLTELVGGVVAAVIAAMSAKGGDSGGKPKNPKNRFGGKRGGRSADQDDEDEPF